MRWSLSLRVTLAIAVALTGGMRGVESRGDDGDWAEIHESGGFIFRSERSFPEWRQVADELQTLRDDIASELGIRTLGGEGEPRIQINLFKSHRTYARHLASRAPAGASRPACFVQGPDLGRVYVVHHEDWKTNVRHEVTHALLHQSLPFIPLWLDEGLAVYFEAPRETRAQKHPYLSTVRWQVRFGWRPNLIDLESREDLSDMRMADYRQSWGWVEFLLHHSDESNQLLRRYLAEIESDTPPGPLSSYMKDSMPESGSAFVRHFKSPRRY